MSPHRGNERRVRPLVADAHPTARGQPRTTAPAPCPALATASRSISELASESVRVFHCATMDLRRLASRGATDDARSSARPEPTPPRAFIPLPRDSLRPQPACREAQRARPERPSSPTRISRTRAHPTVPGHGLTRDLARGRAHRPAQTPDTPTPPRRTGGRDPAAPAGGFSGKLVESSPLAVCSGAEIRTPIQGFKVPCPTLRRHRRNGRELSKPGRPDTIVMRWGRIFGWCGSAATCAVCSMLGLRLARFRPDGPVRAAVTGDRATGRQLDGAGSGLGRRQLTSVSGRSTRGRAG